VKSKILCTCSGTPFTLTQFKFVVEIVCISRPSMPSKIGDYKEWVEFGYCNGFTWCLSIIIIFILTIIYIDTFQESKQTSLSQWSSIKSIILIKM